MRDSLSDKNDPRVRAKFNKLKSQRTNLANKIGAIAHKDWQKEFKKNNGQDATRLKKTKDSAWITRNKSEEVDIANTDYKDLPKDWQKENFEGALSGVDGLIKNFFESDRIEAASDYVHKEWLKRNGSWAPPEQKRPYKYLTEVEKDKDRYFVKAVMAEVDKY